MAAKPGQLIHRNAGPRAGLALAGALVITGCVPTSFEEPAPRPPAAVTPAATRPAPAVVTTPVPEPGTGAPGSAEPVPPPTPVRPPAPVSAASQALLAQSRGHQSAGHYDQAAASIERALRIEPRQPVLWLELGNIRLKEGDYAQAESLGRKALSLSGGDADLTARAEQLITAARKR